MRTLLTLAILLGLLLALAGSAALATILPWWCAFGCGPLLGWTGYAAIDTLAMIWRPELAR